MHAQAIHPLKLLAAPGSPCSRTLRAVLRFRRIAHVWFGLLGQFTQLGQIDPTPTRENGGMTGWVQTMQIATQQREAREFLAEEML